MSNEEVDEVKNEEVTEPVVNEIIETTNEEREDFASRSVCEQPTEQIKATTEEQPKEEPKEEAKPKAKAKARTVKIVELVECSACNKKMLPKSLRKYSPLLL